MILMARHAYEGFVKKEGTVFTPDFNVKVFDEDDGWITVHIPAGLHIYRIIEIADFVVPQILWTHMTATRCEHGWLDVNTIKWFPDGWTKQDQLLEEFKEACERIAQECAEEGYPSHGSNYELRVQDLWDNYYKDILE